MVRRRATRLDKILNKQNAPQKFEFLNIDTEGNELSVLYSLNLDLYRPKLICIEIHDLDLLDLHSSKLVNFLLEKNFKLSSYVNPSAFFVCNLES